MSSPFHEGQRAVQARAAVPSEWSEKAAHLIRPEMSDRHRGFLESIELLFTALLDPAGRPWAMPVAGAPGIALAPSPRDLLLACAPDLADVLGLDTASGTPIGLLGIDPTRQRVRVNGRVAANDPNGLVIDAGQSFGNCPQYIQSLDRDQPLLAAHYATTFISRNSSKTFRKSGGGATQRVR